MERLRLFFVLAIIAVISVVVYYNVSNHSMQEYKGVLVWDDDGALSRYGGPYEGR